MRCPYCQKPVAAQAEECPACRLTYPRARALLGAVPWLAPVVSDPAGLLGAAAQRKLWARITRLERRFQGLVMQVVVQDFDESQPFRLHVFRLFNAAALCGEAIRGANNRALVLAVSPRGGEAALMPGYGLEPLLPLEALDALLALAAPPWREGRWAEGILRVLDGLDALLEGASEPTDAHGLAPGEF